MLELLRKKLWSTTEFEGTMRNQANPVAKRPCFFHILCCNEYHAVLFVTLDGLPHDMFRGGVHTLCRFIEKNYASVAQHTHSKGEHFLILQAKFTGSDFGHSVQVVDSKRFINFFVNVFHAQEYTQHSYVLFRCHLLCEDWILHNIRQEVVFHESTRLEKVVTKCFCFA